MNRLLLIDAAIAAVIAVVVIVVSPGLAVTGLIALLILLACLVSLGVARLRRGHRARVAKAHARRNRRPTIRPR